VVGDRDCSLQRRNQKVIEEAPAPGLSDEIRSRLHQSARRLAQAVGLHGIATCEFLLGRDGTLAFLEINPRIQVEHPVTEQVTGIDLVEWQLLLATGELLPLTDDPTPRAHAIEARVYAEDPWKSFFPAPGTLATVAWPSGPRIRVDAGYASGDQVPAEYDSLLAKIIASGPDRDAALATLQIALSETIVAGVATNLPWLNDLLANAAFRAGQPTTQTANTVTPTLPDRRPALLAAVAQTLDQSEAGANATDPWSSIGPFRLAGSTPLTFHGEDWEERVTIRRGAHAIEIVDADQATPLRWWRDDAGVWTVVAGEVTARLAVVRRDPGELEVSGQGGRWLIRPGPRPPISASVGPRLAAGSDGVVRAPIPARVLRLHTGVGDSVERGQTLVTLSAMKMELACEAPVTGVVETVSCAVDDQVKAGQTLLRVEPATLP
jgi:acetyl/propionyl-CoA carboxylase alpha subunit